MTSGCQKLSTQMNKMLRKFLMSCTEGLIGEGIFNKADKYKLYNAEHYLKKLSVFIENQNILNLVPTQKYLLMIL